MMKYSTYYKKYDYSSSTLNMLNYMLENYINSFRKICNFFLQGL